WEKLKNTEDQNLAKTNLSKTSNIEHNDNINTYNSSLSDQSAKTRLTRENVPSHQQPYKQGQYYLYGVRTAGRPTNPSYVAQDSECTNSHDKVRATMVENLTSSSAQYLRKEEKKEIIFECPKLLMKYTPPPLNEAATHTVCKSNTSLYGIQMALANMTRPLDDYVHKKLKDLATSIKDNDDLEFAHLMQELLSDMKLSGRVPQLVELTLKPLIENKQLGALLEFKKAPTKNRSRKRRHFCLRQQNFYGTAPAVAQTTQSATQTSANTANNAQTLRAEIFKQKRKTKAFSRATRIFPRKRTTRYVLSRLGQTRRQQESELGEAKGFSSEKLYKFQRNKCKATSYGEIKKFFGSEEKFNQLLSSVNSLSASLQAKNKQGGQQRNHQGDCGYSSKECNRAEKEHNTGGLKPALCHTKKVRRLAPCLRSQEIQQLQTRLQDQDEEANSNKFTQHESESPTKQSKGPQARSQQSIKRGKDNAQKFGKLYWKSTSNVNSSPFWLPHVEETPGIKKHFFKEIEFMGCNSDPKQLSDSKSRILEIEADNMEWLITLTRNSRNKIVDSRSYSGLWLPSMVSTHINIKELFASNTTTLAYAQKFEGTASSKLLEVLEKLWLHCMKTNTRPQIASVCNNAESKGIKILYLVSGQAGIRNRRLNLFVVSMEQPILLPTMNSDTTNTTEGLTRENNNINNNYNVEVNNLVFDNIKDQDSRAYTNTIIRDYSRSKKQKISTLQEQIVVTNSMGNQWRTLQEKTLIDLALDLITSNARSIKIRFR
ncbi:hypothetical protein BB561_006520, partial [Smittium simulii]